MKIEDALAYTEACFHGEFASCTYACPLHLDIRSFMEKVQHGSWSAAYRVLRNALVFPGIVSELCDEACRKHCIRQFTDESLAVRDIERACLANVKSKDGETYHIPLKAQRIAVIGAGVSGLACALRLAVKKYQVTVFDQNNSYGGYLRSHPRAALFLEDIKRQLANEEIIFCYDSRIASLTGLEFDAVYVATGTDGDVFGLRDKWNRLTLATRIPGCFLGGMVTGASVIEAIEQGARASIQIEKYLKTGNTSDVQEEYPREKCNRYSPQGEVALAPRTVMNKPEWYSSEEAVTEAGRCLKCNCTACLNACEMLSEFRKKPKQIARDVYSDSVVTGELSGRSVTRLINSCNICGNCKSECLNEVDIGSLSVFSRQDRVKTDTYPAAFHDFWLKGMAFSITDGSVFQLPKGKASCTFAFFPGCQLGASEVDYVKKSYAYLHRHLDGDVGMMLSCCGAPAYWAGDEILHEKISAELKTKWEGFGRPTMIFACATCVKLWQQFIPEASGLSLYEVMLEKGIEIKTNAIAQAAIFDPCAARAYPQMRQSIRELINIAGIDGCELPFHDEKAKCCGWGGHIQIANGQLYDTIVSNRISADSSPYISYCANCRDVFAAKGKPAMHILDVVFALDDGSRKPLAIKQKNDNALRLKAELLKEYWDIDFSPEGKPYDVLKITIDPQLMAKMESKLISETIIKAAIWQAEESGNKFYDVKSQTYIGGYSEEVTTYWVRYSQTGPHTYCLHNVYCHRMRYTE